MDTQSSSTSQQCDVWPGVMGGRDVFVARQPILDINRQVYAYELLFQSGLDDPCFGGTRTWRRNRSYMTPS